MAFLSWYHLPGICNSLELEPVILHCICYILAWSLCILHGICYIWPCAPSILHGICNCICHILALQPLICMVFATLWYFKRSCGLLEGSSGVHLKFHLRFHSGFHVGFHLGLFRVLFRVSFKVSFRVSCRVSFRVSSGFHLRFL